MVAPPNRDRQPPTDSRRFSARSSPRLRPITPTDTPSPLDLPPSPSPFRPITPFRPDIIEELLTDDDVTEYVLNMIAEQGFTGTNQIEDFIEREIRENIALFRVIINDESRTALQEAINRQTGLNVDLTRVSAIQMPTADGGRRRNRRTKRCTNKNKNRKRKRKTFRRQNVRHK